MGACLTEMRGIHAAQSTKMRGSSGCRAVQKMLNKCGFVVHYSVLRHSHTETAPQTAKATGWPKEALIKAVAVSIDGSPALCALCSHHEVDLELLQKLAGATHVDLASPEVLRNWFPSTQVSSGCVLVVSSSLHAPWNRRSCDFLAAETLRAM